MCRRPLRCHAHAGGAHGGAAPSAPTPRRPAAPPAAQSKWRLVAFAVLFGLLIIVSALVLIFVWTMNPGSVAAIFTAILWFLVFLVCVAGVGLFNGVHTVRCALARWPALGELSC